MITIGGKDVADIILDNKNIVKIQDALTLDVMWQKVAPVVVDYFYIQNTYNGSNTITITSVLTNTVTSGSYATSMEYSKDKSNWTTISLGNGVTNTISMSQGEKVYFRNDSGVFNTVQSSGSLYTNFVCSESNNVGGNIDTLIDYTNVGSINYTGKDGCFCSILRDNNKLVNASGLSITLSTLPDSAFGGAFWGCTSLTVPPTLPATTLGEKCYQNMFKSCTSLTTSPALPATTLANNCYQSMFEGCTALVNAPVLPATTLTNRCYIGMFYGCTSLTTAPALPATTLIDYCYYRMFRGCSSLTTPPTLPATTLVSNCYREMFYNCSSLNYINVYANSNSATNCTYNWLNNVAATGTFNNYGSASYTYPSASGIPQGWQYVPAVTPVNDYLYVKNEYSGENTVTITEYVSGGSHSSNINNYWSKDNGLTWNSFKFDDQNVKTKTFTLQIGEFIHFKAPADNWNNYYSSSEIKYYRTITCSQSFSVGGNIKSVCLYDYPNLVCNYGFVSLFKNSTNLIDASNLDLSNLSVGEYCFSSLFNGCTGLTKAPILTLQTLKTGCYQQMFDGCTSLDEITSYASDISAANCIYRWLRNVSPTGTFHNLGGATYPSGVSGIPSGWTIVNS